MRCEIQSASGACAQVVLGGPQEGVTANQSLAVYYAYLKRIRLQSRATALSWSLVWA